MALTLPELGEKNATADPKGREILLASKEGIESYRLLLRADGMLATDAVAGTYMLGSGGTSTGMIVSGAKMVSSAVPVPCFSFDDADYLVTGVTQKLRLRAQVACNATKAAIKFTVGLYPVTVAGPADELALTLGTVVSGSTAEINEPAASTVSSGVGSDFTIPSDGAFALGVVTSGTLTNNSIVQVSAQLQTESV